MEVTRVRALQTPRGQCLIDVVVAAPGMLSASFILDGARGRSVVLTLAEQALKSVTFVTGGPHVLVNVLCVFALASSNSSIVHSASYAAFTRR